MGHVRLLLQPSPKASALRQTHITFTLMTLTAPFKHFDNFDGPR